MTLRPSWTGGKDLFEPVVLLGVVFQVTLQRLEPALSGRAGLLKASALFPIGREPRLELLGFR